MIFLHLKVILPSEVSFSLLSWLAAQTYYPQFYWQHRDESEEVAACGQVKCFNHIRDAHRFLATHRHSLHADDVRIWGLNAWDTIIPGRIDKEKGMMLTFFTSYRNKTSATTVDPY